MKDDLRYRYKIKRKYFQYSAREIADGVIADTLLKSFASMNSFFVYYSYGSEADTHTLIDKLLSAGKEVYLPRVEGKDIVPIRYFGNTDELEKSSFGIYEPKGKAFDGEIDVAVVPLLAVNRNGFRLGYGGGYYDRYFEKNTEILRIGIGYFLQITDKFFEERGDVPLNAFICERGILDFGRAI